MWYICTMESFSHKKEWNRAICSNLDGPGDYHTKWCQSKRRQYWCKTILHGIAYMSKQKKKWYKLTYLQNRNRLTESENELLFPDGKGREEGMTGSYGLTWKLLLLSHFSCVQLCDSIDSSPSGSSVLWILQARILEWLVISFSNACMHAKSRQSCLTLWNPMDSSPPGSFVHGIL